MAELEVNLFGGLITNKAMVEGMIQEKYEMVDFVRVSGWEAHVSLGGLK